MKLNVCLYNVEHVEYDISFLNAHDRDVLEATLNWFLNLKIENSRFSDEVVTL